MLKVNCKTLKIKDMNKRIKQLWIEALESGLYPKGKYFLKKDNCYCPLGILCELYRQQNPKASWKTQYNRSELQFVIKDEGFSSYHLPRIVAEWAGLSSTCPSITNNKHIFLSALNDSTESFEEIIQVIKEQF